MAFADLSPRAKTGAVIGIVVAALAIVLGICWATGVFDRLAPDYPTRPAQADRAPSYVKARLSWDDVPDYDGDGWIIINGNKPDFASADITTEPYERYSPLDVQGRCGVAMACVSPETMPTQKRGSIGSIHLSGWQSITYDFIDGGGSLYNRSHLISFALAAEDLNSWNLVTGTQFMNQKTMQTFENMTLDYVRRTGNHVVYRASPVFYNDELVCRGVHMEAYSVEDAGKGIEFSVFCYNIQPGVIIDYRTGEASLAE